MKAAIAVDYAKPGEAASRQYKEGQNKSWSPKPLPCFASATSLAIFAGATTSLVRNTFETPPATKASASAT
jgi:hypothetical protein